MADAAASELSNVPEDDRGGENAAAQVCTAYVVTEVPTPEGKELEKPARSAERPIVRPPTMWR